MKNKCKHCKYEWASRTEDPKACPKCKRYDWKKIKEGARDTF